MRPITAITTIAVIAAGYLAPSTASAKSPFDGTWKQDMATGTYSKKPDILLIQNGMFHCQSCVPAITVKADGADHAVTGHPAFDTVALSVVDDHTVTEIQKKSGKTVGTETVTLGADGKTASVAWSDIANAGAGATVQGTTHLALVSPGPATAHKLSGSWAVSSETMSDNGALMTFQTDADQVHFSTPTGMSYVAKLDGTEAPFLGEPRVTAVSVKMPDARRLVETDKRAGKVVEIVTMTVAADGKTMSILYDNQVNHRTAAFTARRI